MQGWTDYPMKIFGDNPGEEAPIRQVEVIGWDGDKYALVRCMGLLLNLKISYIYNYHGRHIDNAPGHEMGWGWRRSSDDKIFSVLDTPSIPHEQVPVIADCFPPGTIEL